MKAFEAYIGNGSPTIYPIVQIILSRGDSGAELRRWVDVVRRWQFERVIPAHLDAPLAVGPEQFASTYKFALDGRNDVRFCDEDVALLREAEDGFLGFAVFPSELGYLRGKPCGLGGAPGQQRIVGSSGLRYSPRALADAPLNRK